MRNRGSVIGALLSGLAIGATAGAGETFPPLGRLEMIALETADGWILEASAEGSDQLTSLTLTPPGKPAFPFVCAPSGPSAARCEYADAEAFASLAALLVDFPAGTWSLLVNGTLGASLPFTPVEPDGTMTVTSPGNGATNVGATPSISYTHDCTNCSTVLIELQEEFGNLELEFLISGEPPETSATVPYSDFDSRNGPTPEALPDGLYQVRSGALVGHGSVETLGAGTPGQHNFQYVRGAERDVDTFFVVPEPMGASIAAIASLVALARRRRQSPRP